MTKRVCREPGCGSFLSSYRGKDDFCNVHTPLQGELANWLPDWTADAACAGTDTNRFDVDLPSTGEMTGPVLAAKRMCGECPVRRRCLDYAFALEERKYPRSDEVTPLFGRLRELVFGGLTGRERMRIADDPDRVNVGLSLLDVQRLMFQLTPLRRNEEEEVA